MLQIVSGKLFTQEPGQRNQLRGIVHTNLQVRGREPIDTAAGRLLPMSNLRNTKTLVYELTELLEDPPAVGAVASHGIDPYLNDFAAVVSFALGVTCTPDPELTSRLTSGRGGPLVMIPPDRLVRRVFDDQVWCHDDDADYLVNFIAELIGLERKSYLAAMRAIRTYTTGLHRLADDVELAYTLLVASIESLAQGFDGYRAEWKDYDDSKRHLIDQALAAADRNTASAVRDALLQIEHVSLLRRFRDFTLYQLQPSFFREEAAGLDNPVGRPDLPSALREAYDLRSKYVHSLEELPTLLKLAPSYSETIRVNGATILTFQGMTRLARHVITAFIRRQPKVEKELYDYRPERFGIVSVPVAAQYWVSNVKSLTRSSGQSRFQGFLEQITVPLRHEPNARDSLNKSLVRMRNEHIIEGALRRR